MARRHHLMDAQQALGFMVNQASIIEAAVYRTVYPDIQYPALVPVDETAPEWAKSITFFSIGQVGKADWFHHLATDMRLADITRDKFEQGIEMAGIGYRYTLEEISQAQQLGINLGTERGLAASRAYEEFVEAVVIAGDTVKNWTGLINDAGVSAALVANPGSGTTWAVKTSDQIIADVNAVLTGIYTASNTIEMADTLLLPVSQMTLLATKRLSDAVQSSVLDWIQRYNVFTATTGRPLTIRAVRQLTGAGAGPTDRMVAYRRDPLVVRIHIPMRHRFLPIWQTGPLVFDVPGIFRLGGVEVRRPGAMRYADGI
jgi:hypothetical protein